MTTATEALHETPIIAALLLLLALPVRADFTLGLTAPAWAGFDEGVAAYQRGDYAAALREWRPLRSGGRTAPRIQPGPSVPRHALMLTTGRAWDSRSGSGHY